MRKFLHRLRTEERGATLVEFGFVAPLLLFFIFATLDLSYRAFIGTTLHGAVQKAARDATMENGATQTAGIDAEVERIVRPMVQNGTFTFERKFFQSFSRAGQAEVFTDSNSNGTRDAGECFQDENGNHAWDSNAGRNGQGGADDIVVYKATVTYPRVLPMFGMAGWSSVASVSSVAAIRNQPYGNQAAFTPEAVCT